MFMKKDKDFVLRRLTHIARPFFQYIHINFKEFGGKQNDKSGDIMSALPRF